ncbi:hypothetical protein AVEN_237213-1 [Araneus ventricosus]|uniref:Uncharacterized protein n=1 Tax=Araneus ventricosus TaxID=182803 RepID=A0A4Y2X5W4_ARAVE|nr:hypothetical protein AVEN_237213-1 [Araneus ventricosus]
MTYDDKKFRSGEGLSFPRMRRYLNDEAGICSLEKDCGSEQKGWILFVMRLGFRKLFYFTLRHTSDSKDKNLRFAVWMSGRSNFIEQKMKKKWLHAVF